MFLPLANSTWLVTFEQELLSWTGLPDEPADQIDAAAYAAAHSKNHYQSWAPISLEMPRSRNGIPGLWDSTRRNSTIWW